jgi:hypothetical protein
MSAKRGRRESRRKKPVKKRTEQPWSARFKRLPAWIGVGAAAVTLIAGMAAGAEFLIDTGDKVLSNETGGVEVRQVIVANRLVGTEVADDGQLLQTRASTPQLDVSVLNTTEDSVFLTEARITIVDSVYLPICEYGIGDQIPVSWKYAVELPILPLRSERVIPRPLHQEVPPGEVDRFKLFFRVPPSGLDDFVYALRIALVTDDGSAPVDAGAVVIGLPDAVLPGGACCDDRGGALPACPGSRNCDPPTGGRTSPTPARRRRRLGHCWQAPTSTKNPSSPCSQRNAAAIPLSKLGFAAAPPRS